MILMLEGLVEILAAEWRNADRLTYVARCILIALFSFLLTLAVIR